MGSSYLETLSDMADGLEVSADAELAVVEKYEPLVQRCIDNPKDARSDADMRKWRVYLDAKSNANNALKNAKAIRSALDALSRDRRMIRGDPVLQAKVRRIVPLLHTRMNLSNLPPAAEMPPETDKDALIDALVAVAVDALGQATQKERS